MRILLMLCCLLFSLSSFSQKRSHHPPVITKGFYLSFNPNSILEPEQGAAGLGFGYRFNKKFEAFTELDYLYQGFYDHSHDFTTPHFNNLTGFRSINSFRYFYSKRHGFFTGIEFRIKQYSFNSVNNFENLQLADTLTQYLYKATHTLIGAAVFWGQRINLTANGKFEMESSIGIGVKQRNINWGIPSGYSKIYTRRPDGPPTPDHDVEGAIPYFPGVIKFIYHLGIDK